MPTRKITYTNLTTLNAWQAAAIEKGLELAIEIGAINREHGYRTLEDFRQFSQPGSIIRFEKERKP